METMKARGLEEEREEGRVEGRAEGREEGRAEGIEKNKRDNALRMLRGGLSVADASKFADLSEEEVRRFADEIRR